eukprot:CAMPEP_0173384090 /NCGR_PEP_ID=MMETSP1356-20130122/6655_1 /TAXON_ID=77927 ORGANISM="Hemiselmis virescens, Strain PCC157" /NCGR_SAMPLE_ID=MMETSP1356 /ASSEMBLY_ACC=CAM_ASM_000847 /LENGTH=161 /DNA_ID=CAMNT_0014339269 /DNA_START=25 /DNA_END=510 /DNA_ORIENTATION=-
MGCGQSSAREVALVESGKPVVVGDKDVKTVAATDKDGNPTEQEKAALVIQQRARGMKDRKKVAEQKEKGELPGQIRKSEEELSEKEKAALLIQQRARGMADRKKVAEQKAAGKLPGQSRQQSEGALAGRDLMPERAEGGLEPLGDDVLSGALASPRPKADN